MKLSERDAIAGRSFDTDELHIVRDGLSWRTTLATLLKNPKIPIRESNNVAEIIIFKKDLSIADTTVQSEDGDFVIYVSKTENRLIMGMAIDSVTSYPSDLNDPLKFMKFIDQKAAI